MIRDKLKAWEQFHNNAKVDIKHHRFTGNSDVLGSDYCTSYQPLPSVNHYISRDYNIMEQRFGPCPFPAVEYR